MVDFRKINDTNIRMQHESRGSIFRRSGDKIGGILLRNRLFMRGCGYGVSNAGLVMVGITGRSFNAKMELIRLYHGTMTGRCAGPSLVRNCAFLSPT